MGEPGRHRGAAGVVELGEVGGQGRVIEPAAVEPGVELAEGASVGAAGVVAHRRVDQAARGRRGAADGHLGRHDHGTRISHRKVLPSYRRRPMDRFQSDPKKTLPCSPAQAAH